MFTFAWPWMISLLPIPVIAWYFLPQDRNANSDRSPEILFPYVNRIAKAFSKNQISTTDKFKEWFVILLSLLWFFLVLALMQPQWLDHMEYNRQKGYDIMLAVDISNSMEALDFATKTQKRSRIDVTKEVVSNFADARKGDRLGLILFGEYAYLQVPMTFDTLAVSKMLNNSATGMAGARTAIGDAIGMAAKEIRGRNDKSRVMILLTDGSDNSSNIPPLEAGKIAKHYDIRIYTIGIGSTDGLVPYPDQFGGAAMVQIDMDEDMLKEISDMTGGQYFKATDKNALENIYKKINELEKIEINEFEYKIQKSLYRYPLGIACLLFLVICIMPLLKRSRYA
ncbi:VWA domain-containing protein [Rickettsiaceae bacterium]|nr:VWA domain-containing protein [Rickettsiaceae bacterium]